LLVSDRIYVEDELYESSWTKIRTTTLQVSLSSPYADQITPARPKEVTTSYRMARRGADRFGVGVGVLYTRASSPVYVAADPDPGSNTTIKTTTTTPVTGGQIATEITQPELKLITEKDREPRAGQLAIFANYRLWGTERFGIGPQGGIGLSVDRPSFHAGVVVNASKWLMLGVGKGRFRVKQLGLNADGTPQEPSDRVGSTDDIKIENGWMGAGYATASINILGLPLFSSK